MINGYPIGKYAFFLVHGCAGSPALTSLDFAGISLLSGKFAGKNMESGTWTQKWMGLPSINPRAYTPNSLKSQQGI
ncbi:hypothetical protein [Thalassorhabdomicrobium marinisediminis]|uniref:hypothetical protein n=1 Tax=Thalassorhabdomicrobium marinisediminis TaxID=2170577 RepID=UPI0024922476|nr:hypothetical protein [Thalassorhabdomicrobium marinisediminis]